MKEEDGITFIDVNSDDGKRVKTNAGVRRIPLHPTLIACGLVKYVNKLSEDETRLIWDIPLSGRSKDQSGRGSRKMADLLITAGVKSDKKTFHSFRHNYEDACRIAGIDHSVMNILQGHVQGDMSDRYGKEGKFSLKRLYQAISSIEYKNLTVLHAAL